MRRSNSGVSRFSISASTPLACHAMPAQRAQRAQRTASGGMVAAVPMRGVVLGVRRSAACAREQPGEAAPPEKGPVYAQQAGRWRLPALQTMMSSEPNASTAAFTVSAMLASSCTSQCCGRGGAARGHQPVVAGLPGLLPAASAAAVQMQLRAWAAQEAQLAMPPCKPGRLPTSAPAQPHAPRPARMPAGGRGPSARLRGGKAAGQKSLWSREKAAGACRRQRRAGAAGAGGERNRTAQPPSHSASPATTTRAPSFANSLAVASPMPACAGQECWREEGWIEASVPQLRRRSAERRRWPAQTGLNPTPITAGSLPEAAWPGQMALRGGSKGCLLSFHRPQPA